MTPITDQSRPRLAPKARLRFDRREGTFMLLYPERGLLLNRAAGDILSLCTGSFTVSRIAETLATRHHGSQRDSISADVLAFLCRLQARGLVVG